ncbi:MAG: ComEC/Rec2 family competence protein [bacterium]|nr:ComEC/Rec2 family competence protein [bacterium]
MSLRNWILLFAFLSLIYFLRLETFPRPSFEAGTKIKITAKLNEEPKIVGQTQRFSLSGIDITAWRYPEYQIGSRLVVKGIIRGDNKLEMPEIETLTEEKSIKGSLYLFRKRLQNLYQSYLPEPQASLLSGIVLGSKENMPKDFYQSLVKTGTIHMVVASGMNVMIVSSTLFSFMIYFFSRRLSLILAFLGIWFYVLLSGAETPVLRAGLMASLTFLAQGVGRQGDGWRALIISAFLILIISPLSLFELAFQLSFAATAGIMYFGPRLSSLLKFLPKPIRMDASQTFGAQLATMPLILINFGFYSPLSPLVNLMVGWVLSWTMKIGLIVVILGLFLSPVGQLSAWLAWPFLTYFVKVVEWFGGM